MPPKKKPQKKKKANASTPMVIDFDDGSVTKNPLKRKREDSPPSKFSFKRTLIQGVKNAILAKDHWFEKLQDPVIAAKYRAECIEKGCPDDLFDLAVKELLNTNFELKGIEFDHEVTDPELEGLNELPSAFFKDSLVPEKLRDALEAELDKIADGPTKDFHPNSNGLVLDLIHPSLYCYVEGASYLKDPKNPNRLKAPEAEDINPKSKPRYGWRREEKNPWNYSPYQWLPAEFYIDDPVESDLGAPCEQPTKIQSPINNLDEGKHRRLYSIISRLFSLCVPSFEELLQTSLREKPLQVICKAANYILDPRDEYEGVWHVEGVPSERIVASAIYYYSTTHVYGDGLEFRVPYPSHFASSEYSPTGEREWNMNQYLGHFPTPPGRLLFFTNDLQHRVMRLRNVSKTEQGKRKIFCFFLVNPNYRILSTLDVPKQQWESNRLDLIAVMRIVFQEFVGLAPDDLVELIVDYAQTGFSFKKACEHRLALMEDRKFYRDAQNRLLERSYSLCEH